VRHVGDVAPLPDADDVGEVVLDDLVAVAVEVVVRGEDGRVAGPDDALLAEVRRVPVDFRRDLGGLDDPMTRGGSLSPSPTWPRKVRKPRASAR
jgi:hypothetical protein